MITNQVILYLTVKHVDTESWNELKCKGKWTNRNVFLIHLKCAIYNIVLSYQSFTNTILKVFFVFCIEQWLTTTGVVALAITSTVLGIALLNYFLSATTRFDKSNQQTAFRHPLASKQEIIANIHWIKHNRGRQCVHNTGCQGGRVILWGVRRVIEHLSKSNYSIHATHPYGSIQIHILYNLCITNTEHCYSLEK